MTPLAVLARTNWWVALATAVLGVLGCVFIRSATLGDPDFEGLYVKQAVVLVVALVTGLVILLTPTSVFLRRAAWIYVAAVVALALLPFFGVMINGARRWYRLPGFFVQPSELAKLAVIIALAAYLRFRSDASLKESLLIPAAIAGLPAVMVLRQPDLSSSLVFGPILLAMCFAAGARLRVIAASAALAAALLVLSYGVMHDYQRARVDAWLHHFSWDDADVLHDEEVIEVLRDHGWQPWQALIAIGSGGWQGFGLEQGPQNRYGFLPYRFDDYIFAVIAEETGLLGALAVLTTFAGLVGGLFGIALRTRERFGRLLVVGVGSYLGAQAAMHVAVCTWLVPATGLPLPLLSYGGSSTLVSVWAVALALNVSGRRAPVLASDGYR